MIRPYSRALCNALGFIAFCLLLEWLTGRQSSAQGLVECAIGFFFGYAGGWRDGERLA